MSSSSDANSFKTFLEDSFGQTPSQRHTLFLNKCISPDEAETLVGDVCAFYDCNLVSIEAENYLNSKGEVFWKAKIVVETNLSFQRLFSQ